MRWDEAFADRYECWSAHMTADIPADNRIEMELASRARSSLRWATKNEWLGLTDVAGLQLGSLYGEFAGEPFTEESREYVFITRR